MSTESSENKNEGGKKGASKSKSAKPTKTKEKATKGKPKKAAKRLKKAPNGADIIENNYGYFHREWKQKSTIRLASK